MEKHDAEEIHRYEDLKNTLKKYAKKDVLVIAPHLYYPFGTSAGRKMREWQKCIDCIEYNSFYLKYINFNWKAQSEAKRMNKVLIGSTDAHVLEQIGSTYTDIILSSKDFSIPDKKSFKKTIKDCSREQYNQMIGTMIRNIKKNNVETKTKPLKPFYVIKTLIRLMVR
jgi:predicted metal-dependent phosphoesterase TrpH